MNGSQVFHSYLLWSALGVTCAATFLGLRILWGRFSEEGDPGRLYSWHAPLLAVASSVSLLSNLLSDTLLYSLVFIFGTLTGLLSILEVSKNLSNSFYNAIYGLIGCALSVLAIVHWKWDTWSAWTMLAAVAISIVIHYSVSSLRKRSHVRSIGSSIMAGLGSLAVIDFMKNPFGLTFVWESHPRWLLPVLTFAFMLGVIVIPDFVVGVSSSAIVGFWCSFELLSWFEFSNYGAQQFQPRWHMTLSAFVFCAGYAVFAWMRILFRRP